MIATKNYILEGLCCPNCAEKIEKQLNALDGVSIAAVDFANQRLIMKVADQRNLKRIASQARSIVQYLEPAIVMMEIDPTIEISFTEKQDREKTKPDWMQWLPQVRLGLGALLFALSMICSFIRPVEPALFLISYLLVGGEVVLRALRNISKGQMFDETFLMSLATIGAFALGEYPEGVAVMLFYQVGEAFQHYAMERSRKSISALMDIRPDFANLKIHGEIQQVSPESVGIGNYILVKPGEKIPLDGVVVEGHSTLDASALTGESLPRDVEPGSEVLSGSINKNGLLTIKVSKTFGESTVSKILNLVQNAGSRKARMENFITKFSRYYTPMVVFAALVLALIPLWIIPNAEFSSWLNRALVFLVVSCPCALVISIPLSFFGGIGAASRKGILVKGSNYLEALTNVDTVVFDKTGTLTQGVFRVTAIVPSGCTAEELLYYGAYAESNSSHPIAASIQKAYGRQISMKSIAEYEEIAGQGVRVLVDGKRILAGNGILLDRANIPYTKPDVLGTVVYLVIEDVLAGYIVISDELKPDSKQGIAELKAMGVKNITLFTGDVRAVGEKIGQEIGLDTVYAELLPHQKVEMLEELEKNKSGRGILVFIGDGINDAPVLARADVGIAMGGVGTDAAIEAADLVLMTDEPSKIVEAIQIAKKTRSIVWQNILFALGVKGLILVLGALGIATMWEAVFGDVGVSVIAILNAMRALGLSGREHVLAAEKATSTP